VQGKAVADTSEVLAWVDIKNDGDIALAGYDPVSYHAGADHGPLMGKAVHETIIETLLQGRVRYRFASEENMAKFRAEYRRYKPKYGGFCAAGVGLHETLGSGDPLVWAVDPLRRPPPALLQLGYEGGVGEGRGRGEDERGRALRGALRQGFAGGVGGKTKLGPRRRPTLRYLCTVRSMHATPERGSYMSATYGGPRM
jgi:hypothetical protein